MVHRPDFASFRDAAAEATLVPVYRQMLSDTLTPVGAFHRLGWQNETADDGTSATASQGEASRSSFLFESVVGGEKIGRYSFLGTDPFLTVSARGHEVTIVRGDESTTETVDDPLLLLQSLMEKHRAHHLPELPPFCGGAVGYAGYDTVRYTEHLPNPPEDDRGLPDLYFGLYDAMVIFDHVKKTILVVVHASIEEDSDVQACYRLACERVDAICTRLAEPDSLLTMRDIQFRGEVPNDWTSNFTRDGFESAVERVREYIRAGDAFQVVLSQRLRRQTTATAFDIYRALRVVNPSPFMFLLDLPDCRLVGSSPEIMVRVENGEITLRPLAGTRKRGATVQEDDALAADLLADPKERAEHVMLVDLGRNDVGRVSKYGSVMLSDVMTVERYSHVMHITSNVQGELTADRTALDALRAGLPAGTVSGAPKVRAMEIIDELEPHRRGPYAGAVGYIDFAGNMDTCIALRTLVLTGDTVDIQAGAGLVADSVPSSEYQETLNKAAGLLRAIAIAENQLR